MAVSATDVTVIDSKYNYGDPLVKEYVDKAEALIGEGKFTLTTDEWFAFIPMVMELVEHVEGMTSQQKEDMVYNVCGYIIVEKSKLIDATTYDICRALIHTLIIPATKHVFDINRTLEIATSKCKIKCSLL